MKKPLSFIKKINGKVFLIVYVGKGKFTYTEMQGIV